MTTPERVKVTPVKPSGLNHTCCEIPEAIHDVPLKPSAVMRAVGPLVAEARVRVLHVRLAPVAVPSPREEKVVALTVGLRSAVAATVQTPERSAQVKAAPASVTAMVWTSAASAGAVQVSAPGSAKEMGHASPPTVAVWAAAPVLIA